MSEAPREVILCRYAEIFLKGENRGFFEGKLLDNLRRLLAGSEARIQRLHGRILVWPAPGTGEATLRRLGRAFGLVSFSPARVTPKALPAIIEAALLEAQDLVAGGARPRFKVESRRSDKRFQPSSPELSRQVGAAIVEATGLPVDVHHPEVTVGVEIGLDHAFVWHRTVDGPGGLPVGSSGKADLLLSGGIDSPVAGYLMMKRGCPIAATYFHSFPFTGDRTKDKVVRLARRLTAWQPEIELRVVPFTEAQKALRAAGDPRYAVVLYRRMMLRVAERLARQRRALALVTGDAIGQVASQTLENMAVIGAATSLPLIRPLVANDKLETIRWAERIGTYELSIEPYEDCCSLFVPEHPETRASLDRTLEYEAKVDLPGLVEQCLAGVERIPCVQG